MATEIDDYSEFRRTYPNHYGVMIDDERDVNEVRQWMADPARAGEFYISQTSAYITGISDLICLMSNENTAFEYKIRWV